MGKSKPLLRVAPGVQPPLLGAHSSLFRGTPTEVAANFDRYGLESVQLAPVFPGLRFLEAEDVTADGCRQLAEPFLAAQLHIAGLTAHTNFLDPNSRRRRQGIKRFDALLEHCHDCSTSFVITETGTLKADRPWDDCDDNHTDESFELFCKHLAPSVKRAEQLQVTILLEGFRGHVLSSVERALVVRERFGESIGFVMDPPNYFTRAMTTSVKAHLQHLFATLGAWSPVAHAKDFRLQSGELTMPRAGTGSLDYRDFLELLDRHQPNCPLILEQVRIEELRETIEFIDRFFDTDAS